MHPKCLFGRSFTLIKEAEMAHYRKLLPQVLFNSLPALISASKMTGSVFGVAALFLSVKFLQNLSLLDYLCLFPQLLFFIAGGEV